MVNFFIHRPIFAASIAILMVLAGVVAYRFLPVAQLPEVTPPQVVVTTTYPGASAEVVANRHDAAGTADQWRRGHGLHVVGQRR